MATGSMTRPQGAQQPAAQPILAPNWFLGLVPREFWNKKKTAFFYEGDFANVIGAAAQGNLGASVAANGTATGSINIQQDSHFLCIGGSALVTTTDGITLVFGSGVSTPSQKLITITDAGPGQPLSNVTTPLENLFGTGQLPAMWPIPKLFERGGAIGITVQNINTGTAHTVRLTFWGIRIYPDAAA